MLEGEREKFVEELKAIVARARGLLGGPPVDPQVPHPYPHPGHLGPPPPVDTPPKCVSPQAGPPEQAGGGE